MLAICRGPADDKLASPAQYYGDIGSPANAHSYPQFIAFGDKFPDTFFEEKPL